MLPSLPLRRLCTAPLSLFQALPAVTKHTPAGKVGVGDVGEEVVVRGWLQSVRKLGGLTFVLVRDESGVVQVKLPDPPPVSLSELGLETVVAVKGGVVARPDGMANPRQATGAVEVEAVSVEVLNPCTSLPFPFGASVSEDVALQARYVDLRRHELQRNLRLRSAVSNAVRQHLVGAGFVEVETPTLFRSTPEGAREFLVPTRQAGRFYALVQSPQQYKQMLMASGFERYFQFARCYRDEGGRADRQPEFTQVDIEMAFVEPRDVMELAEGVLLAAFSSAAGFHEEGCGWAAAALRSPPTAPFPRLTYDHVMSTYGSDKPDRRYGLPIHTTPLPAPSAYPPFDGHTHLRGFRVRGLGAALSRKQLGSFEADLASAAGTRFTVAKVTDAGWSSPLTKHMDAGTVAAVNAAMGASVGDLLVFGGELEALGAARPVARDAAEAAGLPLGPEGDAVRDVTGDGHWSTLTDLFWVVGFPLAEASDDGGMQATHHPFTAPATAADAEAVRGAPPVDGTSLSSKAYDMVLNGVEIGGGSVRIHDVGLQDAVFDNLLQVSGDAKAGFAPLMAALRSGIPPHGGVAFGFDRLVAMLCDAGSLRDVIAFPKSAAGNEPMTGSPAGVLPGQLAEYHLEVVE